MSNLYKKAGGLSANERAALAKYLKAAIAASVVTAGVGVGLRRLKGNKDREKALDAEQARNVIVVPIKKESFMEGLPTPEEFARLRGVDEAPSSDDNSEMSQEDIDAKKKEILGSNSRRFDFFGKSSSDRNTEKKAEGFLEMLSNLPRTGSRFVRAGVVRPLLFTTGGLAGIYLASKIVDEVNKIRRRESEENVDLAREEYVKLLEEPESEKKAEDGDNGLYTGAAVLGSTFLIPAALAAIVVNKVMERRKAEANKSKVPGSFPDEPLILYKTSEGRDVEISPETALASILVKTSMFVNAERSEPCKTEKKAFLGFNEASKDEMIGNAIRLLSQPKNSKYLLQAVKGYVGGDDNAISSAMDNAVNGMSGDDKASIWWRTKGGADAYKSNEFMLALAGDKSFQDLLIDKFKNDKEFSAYGNEIVGNELGRTFKKGSLLYNVMNWLSQATGYGNSMITNRIRGFGTSGDSAHVANSGEGSGAASGRGAAVGTASNQPVVNPPASSVDASPKKQNETAEPIILKKKKKVSPQIRHRMAGLS